MRTKEQIKQELFEVLDVTGNHSNDKRFRGVIEELFLEYEQVCKAE